MRRPRRRKRTETARPVGATKVAELLTAALAPCVITKQLASTCRRRASKHGCWPSPVPGGHQRLGSGVHADAIMDRIVHNTFWIETGEVNMREQTAATT